MKPIKCFAMRLENVLEMYKNAGYDIEDDDCDVPNVLPSKEGEWFFTGDLILTDGEPHEIVMLAEWFKWSDVEADIDNEDE